MRPWVRWVCSVVPRGRWIRSSSICDLCVAGFARVRLVRPGSPWGSMCSFGFVWFVPVRPWGLSVRSGSSGSSQCVLGVAGFFRFRLVRRGAPWRSLGSFGFVWFVTMALGVTRFDRLRMVRPSAPLRSLSSIRCVWFVLVRPGGLWVRSDSSCSSGCALGVLEFVWVRLVHPGAKWWVVEFVRVHLVCPGAPWTSVGSFGFVWFVRVCPGCRWVRSGSSALSGCALVVADFMLVCLLRPFAPWRSLGSSGSFRCAQAFAGCCRVRMVRPGAPGGFVRDRLVRQCAPCLSLGSFGCVWIVRVRPVGLWVYSGSSGSSECALVVAGFILVRPRAP